MKINIRGQSGFTLVEIMIVVAIIGLLAAIAIPNFVKARTASQKNACIANLKQIDGAKATFALENKKVDTDPVNESTCSAQRPTSGRSRNAPGPSPRTLWVTSEPRPVARCPPPDTPCRKAHPFSAQA